MTTVSIIGTGNVGYHVHKMIAKLSDYEVVSICGTSIEKAKSIKAGKTASYIDNLNQVPKSDIVLLCVPDTKIKSIAKKLSKLSQLDRSVVAHTSGSVSSSHLSSCKKYGVFYPLQTFTKGQRMSYNIIPFCIHGNTSAVVKKLTVLASLISKDVRKVDDKARKEIHLSAVLVNNMVNHIIHLSQKRLSDQKIAADILLPLIKETVSKSLKMSAYAAQTGPARRADQAVINGHLKRLKKDKQLHDIYSIISDSIIKTYHQ